MLTALDEVGGHTEYLAQVACRWQAHWEVLMKGLRQNDACRLARPV